MSAEKNENQSKRKEFEAIARGLNEFGMTDEEKKWRDKVESLLDIDLTAFRVVAAGQQNSGKSTLLNALCGRTEQDWFETGDRIVTKETKEKEFEGVVYVDTPGLGTTDSRDDIESIKASNGACVVLFVHSCLIGELNADECVRLSDLFREADDPAHQLMVVCSKDGDIDSSMKLEEIVKQVRKQVNSITFGRTPVIAIDSLDYIEGVKADEPILKKSSNVPELMKWLGKNRNAASKAEKTFETVRKDIRKSLEKRKEKLDEACSASAKDRQVEAIYSIIRNKWWNLVSNSICPTWKRFLDISEELRNLRNRL